MDQSWFLKEPQLTSSNYWFLNLSELWPFWELLTWICRCRCLVLSPCPQQTSRGKDNTNWGAPKHLHFVCAFADQLMGYKGGLRCMQMCESSFPCAAIVGSSFWKFKLCFPYCEVSYMKQAFLKFRTSSSFRMGENWLPIFNYNIWK